MKQLPANVAAPRFELKTVDGRIFRLDDAIANGPLVLAFYKASCPTCQLTFPFLQRVYKENPSAMRIVGISQDDAGETTEFVAKLGIEFEVLVDEHPYDVSMAYGFEYVPAIFIIGTDGVIQLSDYGFSKATLSTIGKPVELFRPDDGLPETRPG